MQIVISPELEYLRPDHEENVARSLIKNVADHNDQTDGFTALDYAPNPDEDNLEADFYQFQRIDCRQVIGKNADAKTLRDTAKQIVPQAEELIDRVKKDRKDLLGHFVDRLERDRKFKIVVNHENVIGVMVVGGIVMCAAYESDLLDPSDVETGLFVSDMIKFTKFRNYGSTVGVLAGLVNHTLFTEPPTDSIKNSGIDDSVPDATNPVTLEVHAELEANDTNFVTYLAGSGQRDRKKGRRFGKHKREPGIYMGPLSFGTERIIGTSWLLPGGINMSARNPSLFLGSVTKPPEGSIASHAVMNTIAEGLTAEHGKKHFYISSREEFSRK